MDSSARTLWVLIAAGAAAVAYACATRTSDPDGGPRDAVVSEDARPGTDAGPSCPGPDPGLGAACEALCAAGAIDGCGLVDFAVPYVYGLYYVPRWTTVDDCVTSCMNNEFPSAAPETPSRCGPEVRAMIECVTSEGFCDPTRTTPVDGDGYVGSWTGWTCVAEADALYACGERCVTLPTCDSDICNGSMSAGDVFCSWSCVGRVCERQCN